MEEESSLRKANCRAKGVLPGFKVAILGATGGIGRPLAMLMKINPLVSVLHLYDVVNTAGVTADISHMDTAAMVRGFWGKTNFDALTSMDLVVIPTGVPQKPRMTRMICSISMLELCKIFAKELQSVVLMLLLT